MTRLTKVFFVRSSHCHSEYEFQIMSINKETRMQDNELTREAKKSDCSGMHIKYDNSYNAKKDMEFVPCASRSPSFSLSLFDFNFLRIS